MQSWGSGSVFEQRNTMTEPTKSGVLGLLCAALGRDRSEPLQDLLALRMGVRCDKPGVLQEDFQTALGVAKSGTGCETQLSRRAYLSDAAFWVALEGEQSLLTKLHQALLNPVWPLFLGRKSYLASVPFVSLHNSIVALPLEEALASAEFTEHSSKPVKLVIEQQANGQALQEVRTDVPVTFELGKRAFTERLVTVSWLFAGAVEKEI